MRKFADSRSLSLEGLKLAKISRAWRANLKKCFLVFSGLEVFESKRTRVSTKDFGQMVASRISNAVKSFMETVFYSCGHHAFRALKRIEMYRVALIPASISKLVCNSWYLSPI